MVVICLQPVLAAGRRLARGAQCMDGTLSSLTSAVALLLDRVCTSASAIGNHTAFSKIKTHSRVPKPATFKLETSLFCKSDIIGEIGKENSRKLLYSWYFILDLWVILCIRKITC